MSPKNTIKSAVKTMRTTAAKAFQPSVGKKKNQALTEKIAKIRALFKELGTDEAMAKHEIGREVAVMESEEKKYGKGWVKILAAEVGRTPATLYSHATVAKAWSKGEFASALKELNGKGLPLTFCHFVELEKVKHAGERDALQKRALDDALSVRDLKAAVRLELGKNAGLVTPAKRRPTSFEAALTSLDQVVAALSDVSAPRSPQEISKSEDAFKKIIATSQNMLSRLRECPVPEECEVLAAE